MVPPRPSKKDVMLALLEKSGVFVHLDPRIQGVVVPDGFRRQPELVLQFGLNMAIPIKDLEVDEEAVSGTLSFARRPFWVKVPWDAIYALVSDEDQRGMVWPEDAPRESKLSQGAPRPAEKPRPRLRAVGPDDPAPTDEDEAEEDERDGSCGQCKTPWLGGGAHCAVCGAARSEAFRAEGEELDEQPPARVGEDAAASAAEAPIPSETPKPKRARPALSAVPTQDESGTSDEPSAGAAPVAASDGDEIDASPKGEGDPKPKKRPSHLRLVK